MRIAVVDDEKNWLVKIKRYIKEYFGEMDVEIRTFFSGEAFLEDAGEYQMVSIPVCFLGEQRLQCYDILYFEVYGHVVLMHTREGETYHCTEPLKSLARKLKDKGFVLTNRSYLVNLEHIRKVEQDKVCLSGNQTLLLSRGKCASIRKQHFEWKMRRANG